MPDQKDNPFESKMPFESKTPPLAQAASVGSANRKVKVKLEKPHTHEDRKYEPGDVIELYEDQADALRRQGVIK